jgi:hypothetical protein
LAVALRSSRRGLEGLVGRQTCQLDASSPAACAFSLLSRSWRGLGCERNGYCSDISTCHATFVLEPEEDSPPKVAPRRPPLGLLQGAGSGILRDMHRLFEPLKEFRTRPFHPAIPPSNKMSRGHSSLSTTHSQLIPFVYHSDGSTAGAPIEAERLTHLLETERDTVQHLVAILDSIAEVYHLLKRAKGLLQSALHQFSEIRHQLQVPSRHEYARGQQGDIRIV